MRCSREAAVAVYTFVSSTNALFLLAGHSNQLSNEGPVDNASRGIAMAATAAAEAIAAFKASPGLITTPRADGKFGINYRSD